MYNLVVVTREGTVVRSTVSLPKRKANEVAMRLLASPQVEDVMFSPCMPEIDDDDIDVLVQQLEDW